MSGLLVATQTGGILGPFAWILGKILEYLYDGFSLLGIYNIGFLIIIFTLVVRMLMLPMTIKQQKFAKLNTVMNPEIQAIQKKYQNKKDQQSQLAMQEEMKAVYDKYGTSPTGSCLQLIIQMPILFALYRVIMNIPAYVQPIKNLYIDVINHMSSAQINQFFTKKGSVTSYIDAMSGYASRTNGGVSLSKGTTLNDILNSVNIDASDKIRSLNRFFGLDLSKSPSDMFDVSKGALFIIGVLAIPVLAGLFQFLSVQLSQKMNKTASMQDNPMAGSMKVMNIMMPLISVYMCWQFSIGIGLYWMAGSGIMMIQQIFVNMHLNKVDVNDIIEENKEKAAKKAEKRKAKQGIYRDKVLEASKSSTRSFSNNSTMTEAEREEKIAKAKSNAKQGSMASKVNMVKDYNERNKK